MEELWDLYRISDGRYVKTIAKGSEAVPPELYHDTVEVIPTDKAGHMLLTRRAFCKVYSGGKFEFPAGSVFSGESPFVAARRELREETGLKAVKLQKVGAPVIPGLKRHIYIAHIPDLLTAEITLQEGETIDYRIVTYEEWLDLADQNQCDTSRLAMYSNTIHRSIQLLVGIPEKEPEQKVLRLLHPTQIFSGVPANELLEGISLRDDELDHLEAAPILNYFKAEEFDDAET